MKESKKGEKKNNEGGGNFLSQCSTVRMNKQKNEKERTKLLSIATRN